MTQIARPEADVVATGYTDAGAGTSNLYASIDEVAFDDADFVASPFQPVAAPYVCRLSALQDPVNSISHAIRYRYACRPSVGAGQVDLTVQLRQSYQHEGIPGYLIASWTHLGISTVATTQVQTLTADQADTIDDYGDLFLRFSFNQTA